MSGRCFAGHMVGVAGFEPTASRSQSERATKLRHTPPEGPVRTSVRIVRSLPVRGARTHHGFAGPREPGCLARGFCGKMVCACGCSSMVEPLPSKQTTRVRFSSSAPRTSPGRRRRSSVDLRGAPGWWFDQGRETGRRVSRPPSHVSHRLATVRLSSAKIRGPLHPRPRRMRRYR
jgi:hypothetical protein